MYQGFYFLAPGQSFTVVHSPDQGFHACMEAERKEDESVRTFHIVAEKTFRVFVRSVDDSGLETSVEKHRPYDVPQNARHYYLSMLVIYLAKQV